MLIHPIAIIATMFIAMHGDVQAKEGECAVGRAVMMVNGIVECQITMNSDKTGLVLGGTQSSNNASSKSTSSSSSSHNSDSTSGGVGQRSRNMQPMRSTSSSKSDEDDDNTSSSTSSTSASSSSSNKIDCSKYTGTMLTSCNKINETNTDASDIKVVGGTVTATTSGPGSKDRNCFRIHRKGPSFGKSIKFKFSSGYTITVADSTKRYENKDGFLYRPGFGSKYAGTGTTHGGIFLCAPSHDNSTSVTVSPGE